VKFILIDKDTIEIVKSALQNVDSKFEYLSLGSEPLKGTTHISELLNDDGSGKEKNTRTLQKSLQNDIFSIRETEDCGSKTGTFGHFEYKRLHWISKRGCSHPLLWNCVFENSRVRKVSEILI